MANSIKISFTFFFALWVNGLLMGQNWSPELVRKAGEDYIQSKKHPGLVISVWVKGEEKVFAFGESERGSGEMTDGESVFELGGLSQVFTTTLMAKMTYDGLFSPERALIEYLPGDFPVPGYQQTVCLPPAEIPENIDDNGANMPKRADDYNPTNPVFCYPVYGSPPGQITFCQTASHTSGLPAHLKKPKQSCENLTEDDLRDLLTHYFLENAPGMVYQPSEVGVALMGFTLGNIDQSDFESALTSRVTEPLGLNQTRISAGPGLQTNLMQGHSKSGKTVPHCEPGILGPALGLRSTGNDMLAFLEANLAPPAPVWVRVFQEVHQSRISLGKGTDEGGYGWKISRLPEIKGQITWQEGSTPGFRSYMGMNLEQNYGLVILSNSADPIDELALQLMQLLQ
ncbi:MAG: beta-lactamase family protein [Bacteroidia bacterium]|nr:beta-lactamase family protein [Bacteroidia bacterium]